ncbi:hypothetical protein [Tenacibaculum halocynthiae]|uniref:hypothetical protein n=1 Tax=Tenacibaculum halocynthiae TaxID=1254437 RepID=UPI003D652C3E
MEKNKNISLDNDTIINLLGCLIPIIIIAMLTRVRLSSQTSNEFIANTLFVVIILTGIYVYLALMQIIENLISVLAKFFLNKRKIKTDSNKKEFIAAIEKKEILEIIDKKQKSIKEIEKQKLEIAIQYTKEEFASYVTKEDLIKLCDYIEIYSKQGNLDMITPIEVSQLKYFDVYHFGWNIWNYFKEPNNHTLQIEIAELLKNIFKELLKDVEVDVVKKHLKAQKRKGIIKIEENIINTINQNK